MYYLNVVFQTKRRMTLRNRVRRRKIKLKKAKIVEGTERVKYESRSRIGLIVHMT